jgi:geranylgeranylglycerol-phosphate geranylgeranyltransferase
MPASWPASLATLVRLRNLLLAAAGVAIGGVLALGRLTVPPEIWWAIGSAIGLGAAGNVANDLADLDADRINRPERPLVTGRISTQAAILVGGLAGGMGLLAAWWCGPRVFAVGLAALVVMLVYSPLLKRHGLLGNLAVALIAGLPPAYGALALGSWQAGLVPSGLAAILHLAREVVKDLEDEAGDRVQGRHTLPIAWGRDAAFLVAAISLILFVPTSLAPWFAGWYGRRYGAGVLAINLFVLALVWRLLGRQLPLARPALKAVMVAGLAVLLWDRL